MLRPLGEGGMGVVYEAMDEQIGRRVAIKRLHGEYSRQPDIVQRFFNEARAVNLISHPAIVQVSELATAADGSAYLVMEYLAGSTLSQRLTKNRGTLCEPATLRIISQLASALAAAHEVGITHRDHGRKNNICSQPGHRATQRRRTDDDDARFAPWPV